MRRIAGLAEVAHLFGAGCRVVIHTACAAPPRLCTELVALAAERGPFGITDLTTIGSPAYLPGVEAGSLRLTTLVPGRAIRRALRRGEVDVRRTPLSRAPMAFSSGALGVDVLLMHVAPPSADGRFSFGLSCDAMPAALGKARTVIAEINPAMPRTLGPSIAAGDVDYWIDGGAPPVTVDPPEGDPVDVAIAEHVASLIASGDVLQTGIGALADLTAARLTHLSDLGLHTGIITEAVQPLIERGVVTNAQKTVHRGVSVATLAAGSADFYRFLDGNPEILLLPCDETHAAATLAGMPRLVAINGALEMDLAGRVNAEAIDGRPVSGPGGQPDFAAGAVRSPGGKSIIALRATSKDGATSRIVPALAPDAPVTVDTRSVDYVVTEFGIAEVSGHSGFALVSALAGIAAPQFRADLRRAPG